MPEKKVYNKYYYNSNLIWRTESRLVDKVIPFDYPRRDPLDQIKLLL